MTQSNLAAAPAHAQLLRLVGAAVLGAALVFAALIVPAEFHLDPLSTGRLTA